MLAGSALFCYQRKSVNGTTLYILFICMEMIKHNKLVYFVRIHMHNGTRFGRTAQGYGFVGILAGVHDVGGISRVWRR